MVFLFINVQVFETRSIKILCLSKFSTIFQPVSIKQFFFVGYALVDFEIYSAQGTDKASGSSRYHYVIAQLLVLYELVYFFSGKLFSDMSPKILASNSCKIFSSKRSM